MRGSPSEIDAATREAARASDRFASEREAVAADMRAEGLDPATGEPRKDEVAV